MKPFWIDESLAADTIKWKYKELMNCSAVPFAWKSRDWAPKYRLLCLQTALLLMLPARSLAQLIPAVEFPDSTTIILRPVLQARPHLVPHLIDRIEPARPRIGLALSGGGARCLAQIGALQVLEANQIPIDAIVGTSMGAIVGGLYASGYTPAEIETIVKSINWSSILVDRPPRRTLFFGQKQKRDRLLIQVRLDGLKPQIPPAFTPGQKIQSVLTQLTMQAKYVSNQSFDGLRVPFRAVCTDLYTGEKVVLSKGDLAEALRATLAFPLLFTPVPRGDKLLVDGGLVDNIPVDEVRKLGMDLVVAVDASSNLRTRDQLHAPWEIADQVTSILQRDRTAASRKNADIFVRIDDPGRTNMDFSNLDSLIALGRREMARKISEITAKIRAQRAAFYRQVPVRKFYITHFETNVQVQELGSFLAINNNGHGRTLSAQQIISTLEKLAANYAYTDVFARLTASGSGYTCEIVVKPAPPLREIQFRGNTIFSSDSLLSSFQHLLNKPVNQAATEQAIGEVLSRYRKSGYSLAKITAIRFDEHSGRAVFIFDEGKIQAIRIRGLQRTKKYVVLRDFPQKSGDIFNFKQAQKGIDNIFGTGLFDRVSISLNRKPVGAEIQLKLHEKKYTAVGLSGHSDSERHTRALIEFSDENLAGTGAKFALSGDYGSRDKGVRSKFSIERIFRTYLTFNAEAYFTRRENFAYRRGGGGPFVGEYVEKRFGASLGIGQLVERLGVTTVELHTDRFELETISGTGFTPGISIINRLVFRSILDTRDRLPFPTKGRFVHFYYDLSNKLFNQQLSKNVSFFRTFLTIETFNTIARNHTFNPRFTIGTADLTTPFVFQFRLSGFEHLFGLRDQELIGRHFVLGNFTYRYKLPRFVPFLTYLGARYDVGGAWDSVEKANYGNLTHAIGIFLGLDSFLGAIQFAWGRASTGQQRFYFSIGPHF